MRTIRSQDAILKVILEILKIKCSIGESENKLQKVSPKAIQKRKTLSIKIKRNKIRNKLNEVLH